MPPADAIIDPEEDYASEEDSDFAPEDAPANESAASDNEDSGDDKAAPGKQKRQLAEAEAEDAGFENSGDEAVIDKGKKRRKKGKGKDDAAIDDDEADGPLIKTRSMRAVEYDRLDHIHGVHQLTARTGKPKNAQRPPAARSQSMSTQFGRRC